MIHSYLKRIPALQTVGTLFRVCAFGSAFLLGASVHAANAESILNIPLERTSTEPSYFQADSPLDYSMDVYYPSNLNSQAPCPLIIVYLGGHSGPGQSRTKAEYSDYCENLAAAGFVVAIPQLLGTATIKVPCIPFDIQYPDVYDPDQPQTEEVRNGIIELANDPSSPLYNKVDVNTVGLTGHAWGGSMCLFTVGNYRFPYYLCDLTNRPIEPYIKAVGTYVGETYDHNLPPFVPALELPIDQGGIPVALSVGSDDVPQVVADVLETFANLSNGEKFLYVTPNGTRNSIINPNPDASAKEIKAHRKTVKFLEKFFIDNLVSTPLPMKSKIKAKTSYKAPVRVKK
jgi:dienelactone hydrolase